MMNATLDGIKDAVTAGHVTTNGTDERALRREKRRRKRMKKHGRKLMEHYANAISKRAPASGKKGVSQDDQEQDRKP